MAIIISKNGKDAKKINKSIIDKEDYLQKYIYDNPETIPLYEINENLRICILAREVPTNSGAIDGLGIDQDGNIYIIETKLYKNPDKRLVVAQVLDYGASLWNNTNDFEGFMTFFEKASNKRFQLSLNQRLMNFFQLSEEEVFDLRENIKINLGDGNYKFVILMDRLSAQLRDLIVFINQNSQFDIYAVELEYYKYQEYEIIIPKLYGAEVKKDINIQRPSKRKKWNENLFFDEVNNKLDRKYVEAIQKLYEFSKQYADEISWGTGFVQGSFNPKIRNISQRSLFSVFTDGTLQINFDWLNDNDETKRIRTLLGEELMKIKDLAIPPNYFKHCIGIPIENWYHHVDEITSILMDIVKQGRVSHLSH